MAAAAALSGGEYAQELCALKLELQATITRLSGDLSLSFPGRSGFQSPSFRGEPIVGATQREAALTAGTPATTVSTSASSPYDAGRYRQVSEVPAVKIEPAEARAGRGNDAQTVLQELARVARRREELERQLLDGVQRDERRGLDSAQREEQRHRHRRRHNSRKTHERKASVRSLHRAIEELQRQRQEILRQIDAEAAADSDISRQTDTKGTKGRRTALEPSVLPDGLHQTRFVDHAAAAGNNATAESQYSIGGIVTLEPLAAAGAMSGRTARFPGAPHPQIYAALHPQPAVSYAPRVVYPTTLDALNDVFSIQLKFAETMLQLEQSVQVRDQLLRGRSLPHHRHRRPRPEASSRSNPKQLHHDRGDALETSMAMSSSSDDDEGDVADSDTSTVDYGRRQQRRRSRQLSVESSQHVSTPSSSADTARNASSINSMAVTASASARTSPSVLESSRASSPDHCTPEPARRPPGTTHLTTPSTGSSKKSDASSKQVHFGENEFPTPLLARKFSFGSSDEDEDGHADSSGGSHKDEVMSALSMLDGSSIHSSELNDASFLRAFDEFRRELKTERPERSTASTGASSSTARALYETLNAFMTPEKVNPNATGCSRVQEDTGNHQELADASPVQATTQEPTEPAEAQRASNARRPPEGEAELMEHRRQLCLDIQSESATLALSFAMGDPQAQRIKAKLRALRDELGAVDAQLQTA